MITVVSDTHGTEGHRLEGRTLRAVRESELVVHAGDFTTASVLDAFEAVAGADVDGESEFVAVFGNNDEEAVRERLAETAITERGSVRIATVHGHEHDDTGLSLLGRQEGADVVAVGHSHQPGWRRAGAVAILNPGSHADPRWYRPAHAELEPTPQGLEGRLVSPNGEAISEFELDVTGHE